MPKALISVSDKDQLIPLAQKLVDHQIEIISTGGTLRYLQEQGIPARPVEEVTGFPEMMDGRVKTLHPKIHGGLLALRDKADHQQALSDHQIDTIDYLIVNLYPFKQTIMKDDVTLADAIENIDIGGPSMLRSAAKNYHSVTVVVDPQDYATIMAELDAQGHTSFETRQALAQKVFATTANYDTMIARYLEKQIHASNQAPLSTNFVTLTYEKIADLPYGENSHQAAQVFQDIQAEHAALIKAQQWNGKPMSYNNYRDVDCALRILTDFQDKVCAVAIKHINPCGVAIGDDIDQAFDRCYEADPVSIFGGIVAFNRPITKTLAERLSSMFLDVILAPGFEEGALDILKTKVNVRVITFDPADLSLAKEEVTSIGGGLLVQAGDDQMESLDQWQTMTKKEADAETLAALDFAWRVVKHVKSNGIVVTNAYQTLGIGPGQTNRVGSAKIAIQQAQSSGHDLSHMVLASDAFIPMTDTLDYAHQEGVKAIVQTGGSIKDAEVVERANEYGLPMYATGARHFRH